MDTKTVIEMIFNEPEALKYPKIVESWTERINNELNWNLGYFDPNDTAAIISQLKCQESNSQGRHTFFEVVLGGLFARSQYGPRYEQNIDGLTPDWVLTIDSRTVKAVSMKCR